MDMDDIPLSESVDEYKDERSNEKLIAFSTGVHELTTRLIENYPTIDTRELFKFTSKLLKHQAKYGPLIMSTSIVEFDELKESNDLWPTNDTILPVLVTVQLATMTNPFVSDRYGGTLSIVFRVKKHDSKLS